ncbi:zf-B_box domain-containing protein [Cephalotus follicularis]|uniref:Zf-B_box domain-containing protein n=1 Tax=Cephalotus follicularis TaxID=3775 RepID=A0A1Q3AYF8_CEPFO|nr:zf-B_box domain-containing protein [Cephalotus follicularis]
MKIQCNVCEVAEANVLCCADEAALCWACDVKVHAANKLASKHTRVPLSTSSSSQIPKCDICQEIAGFFFCLEDRALLCRKCDVAIHTANTYVSAHQRFLLTGVKVGLETTDPGASTSTVKSRSVDKISETKSYSVSRRGTPMPLASDYNRVLPVHAAGVGQFTSRDVPYSGGSPATSIPQWQMDEFLGITDINPNYVYIDNGSSKAGSSKNADSDSSSILRSAADELDDDECLGQVPETSWAVPQTSSPPTASGLHWPKKFRKSDSGVFVPDICCSGTVPKRRRQF